MDVSFGGDRRIVGQNQPHQVSNQQQQHSLVRAFCRSETLFSSGELSSSLQSHHMNSLLDCNGIYLFLFVSVNFV